MAEGGRHSHGEDHISGLPDDLLHVILTRSGSARAAARTGVLSRRWRHVWTQIPELVLFDRDDEPPPASFPDSIDAALAAHSAPTVKLLSITVPSRGPRVPVCRVAPWLHFAAQRVVGTLSIDVPWQMGLLPTPEVEEEELEIPACAGAERINLNIDNGWRLRLPPQGLFAALIRLTIQSARVEGNQLTALVSTQCPRLKSLFLDVALCVVSEIITIRTDSLESLWCRVNNTSLVEVVGPRLERLTVRRIEIHVISAPKLAELDWYGHNCDPCHNQFVDVGRHLRLLKIRVNSRAARLAPLLQRFDSVDELELDISISLEILGYQNFLNETKMLPKCETLSVSVRQSDHGLVSIMLHLLKSCSTTRKISVTLYRVASLLCSCPLPCCLCRLVENCKIDDIALGSLEEVEIINFTSSQEEVEIIEMLSRCNASILKKIVICYTQYPATKEVCQKIRSKCRQNLIVEFYVHSGIRWVPLD